MSLLHCLRALETPLSSERGGLTESQADGARPAACPVGAAGWARARAKTGAKLFLNRSRDAADVPAVGGASVAPPQPLSSFTSRQSAVKATNH